MTAFGYRDADGLRHEVIVRRTPTGDWQVLDTCQAGTSVIETLDRDVDDRPQADAVARDYVEAGRLLPWAGSPRTETIPEQRGADAHSARRRHREARQPQARGAALSRQAG